MGPLKVTVGESPAELSPDFPKEVLLVVFSKVWNTQ